MSLRRSRPPSSLLRARALTATAVLTVGVALGLGAAPASATTAPARGPSSSEHAQGVRLYVPPPDPGAVTQITALLASGRTQDALGVLRMVSTPQAVWFTGGTPAQVRAAVRRTVTAAARRHAVPVLVAYDLPFRDCAQYSAGGAADTDAYLAWIRAFAAGLGNHRAIVALEPDGLGIIPNNIDINGNAEWCQPKDAAGNPLPGATPAERYRAITGAVDRLTAHRGVSVYLDGTHSAWLGVGDIASRLVKAHVQQAAGFFLDVSNFETTSRQQRYGTWISSCIAFAANPADGGWRLGHYDYCASQYYPADPTDESTWWKTDAWYAANLGTARPTTHFVVDTSRNGKGPWTPPADHPAGDPEAWCNPPDRGLGARPTTRTGVPLNDALLWIKTPGQSDGQCHRWTTGPVDPVRGMVDPVAGAWFPQMALELVHNAVPPIVH